MAFRVREGIGIRITLGSAHRGEKKNEQSLGKIFVRIEMKQGE